MRKDDSRDVVRYLVTSLGVRSATSLGEARAAAYVDGRLRRGGMNVSADPFFAPTSLSLTYLLLALLGVLAALLAGGAPFPSLLLALWLLGVALIDARVAPLLLPLSYRNSQNIVGNQACELPPRWRVVLLSPLDAPGEAGWLSQYARWRQSVGAGRVLAFGLLALLSLLRLVRPSDIWWYGQIVPAVYLLISLFPLRSSSNHAYASLGSAGALAVLLTVAELLPPLRTVEVWVVALGATTTGNSGINDLLARYPFPQERTLFLALEKIDSEELGYVAHEGTGGRRSTASLLAHLAHRASTEVPSLQIQPSRSRTVNPLAIPLHRRGYHVLTLRTSGNPASLHHLVEPDENKGNEGDDSGASGVFEQVARFIVAVMQNLDSDNDNDNDGEKPGS